MSTQPIAPGRRFSTRVLLILLGGPQLLIGLWALLAPRGFYADFPGGPSSGWVSRLGPYDEHLVRDVGELFVALGVLLLISAVVLERRLVLAAAVAWLVYCVPHTVFHALNSQQFSTADAVGNMAGLVWTVLGGVAVLWLARRPRPGCSV